MVRGLDAALGPAHASRGRRGSPGMVASVVASSWAMACAAPAVPPPDLGDAIAVLGATRFRAVELDPPVLRPGEPVTVRLRVEGPPQPLQLRLQPPRIAAWQPVSGGGPAPTPPSDPRSRLRSLVVGEGTHEVIFEVPQPWHARTAVLSAHSGLSRPPIPSSVAGPRAHDLGVFLAVLDVEGRPTRVRAVRAEDVVLDGRLDERVWTEQSGTALVGTLDGEPMADLRSRVWFAWTPQALLVAALHEDEDLRGTQRDRDDPLWEQEAFELFLFADARRERYLEFQVSALGTRFDARFERYRDGDFDWNGNWAAVVAARGTIEREGDRDEGWTVEISIPWVEICEFTEAECPPEEGMQMRVNAFRIERPRHAGVLAGALSPPRVPDFHAPENAAMLELIP